MNNKTLHIIGNEFIRKINHSAEWWEYRLMIYEQYCLTSLKNQTNKNFMILMSVCEYVPEKNQISLLHLLEKCGLQFVMYDINKITIAEALQQYSTKYDTVYHTRIDSDDMFHKDVISEIQSYDFAHRRALVFQKGYCYDCRNNRLQHYFMPSPPFSTIMFPMSIYLDQQKQNEYTQTIGHDTIFRGMKSIKLSENKYIVTVHNTNQVTIYQDDRTKFRGHETEIEIQNVDINIILKDFGISSDIYKTKIII